MRLRLVSWWYEVQSSLWFLPALLTAAAVLLAYVTIHLDGVLPPGRMGIDRWFFGGGPDGARGVLAAIAGTMVTVTALVFSITVVALQLASSQLSPRVLRSFMADRGNQIVLGVFIGSFTYALLVLRVVRGEDELAPGFVPSISITVAILLAMLSVGLLIFYIHHAANSMRAAVVIDHAAETTMHLIASLYPGNIGHAAPHQFAGAPARKPDAVISGDAAGYLQSIDAGALFALAEHHDILLRLELLIGDFVLPGAPLACIWLRQGDEIDDDLAPAVRGALVLGFERTLQDDLAFGVQQLSDIAIKALSPAINDPTTATVCIDRLSEVLVRLGNREEPAIVRAGDDGRVCLVLTFPTFEKIVGIAFDQIRHYGSGDPVVARYLLNKLQQIAALVPEAKRPVIVREAISVRAAAMARAKSVAEHEIVEPAAAWIEPLQADLSHQATFPT